MGELAVIALVLCHADRSTQCRRPARPLSLLPQAAEGDRVAQRLDRRNAVLPLPAARSAHEIDRARLGGEGIALPFRGLLAAQAEGARAGEGNAEHVFE